MYAMAAASTHETSAREVSVQPALNQLAICKICLTDCPKEDIYKLGGCQCVYCEMCVIQYLEVLISEGDVLDVPCPDASCRNRFVDQEIEALVDSSMRHRYRQFKLEKGVAVNPNLTFCPGAECSRVCQLCTPKSDNPQSSGVAAHCNHCDLDFCTICKSEWTDSNVCKTCVNPITDEGLLGLNPDCQEVLVKRCPACNVLIERAKGCAQMICQQCKHVFCWYCLDSLQGDFLLRHYDKGTCKNKLGHSRASVVWHRAQVVGMFAGFTVLFLLVSPIILMATPCILCCKFCKPTESTDDEKHDLANAAALAGALGHDKSTTLQ